MNKNYESELNKQLKASLDQVKSNVVPFPSNKSINSGNGHVGNNIQQFGESNYFAQGDINIFKFYVQPS